MGKKNESSKRKAYTEVLPLKSAGDKDEFAVTDDLSEPTMGEKLASLKLEGSDKVPNNDNVDKTSIAKPPSADSVYILLKQALRADDRALLIDCLYRQDEKVIANSLSLLNPSDVLKFLQSLISIIQLRGAVLACALPWLKSLLLQHAGSIISQEQSLAVLNSFYQLIESRVSTFDHALKLSSCLDLLYAESMDDGVEENDVVMPVIFEDNDDSDDEGSTDSMDVETVEDGEEPQADGYVSGEEENRITCAKQLMVIDAKFSKDFKFEHARDIMKDFEKLNCTSQKSGAGKLSFQVDMSESQSPISLDGMSSFSINLSNNGGSGSTSQRSDGVKKSKLKRKRGEDMDDVVNTIKYANQKICELFEASNANRERNREIQLRKIESRQKAIEARQKAIEAKRWGRETEILMINTESISNSARRLYFEQEQARILAKRQQLNQSTVNHTI